MTVSLFTLKPRRALGIARGEIEAYGVEECIAAWQRVHDLGLHYQLLDWQLGVMQNLVFGQVVESAERVIPHKPARYSPYGALRGIETR